MSQRVCQLKLQNAEARPKTGRVALHRLRTKLAVECRVTREQVPSRRWLDRVKNEQLLISVDHHDYALLVAEAFDHLALCNGEMRTVSDFLRVTPTQLAGNLSEESYGMDSIQF